MNAIRKHEEEEKRRLVEEWDRSGLSADAFGKSRGVRAQTLHRWGREIRGPLRLRSRTRPVPRTLEIVEVGSQRASEPRIEVVLTNGRRLVVFSDWTPERVAHLALQLETHE